MYRQRNKLITRYRGLSTDTKPQYADHGSTFHEMDTGTVYYYDKAGGEWYEAPGGKEYVVKTVSGNPIVVSDALEAEIQSLIVSHTTTQDGTPTPSAPVDIVCNNGALQYGAPIAIPSTGINAYIDASGAWKASSDSYSICVEVEVGKKYAIRWTNTSSADVGNIFRYGFSDTPAASGQTLTQFNRTSPQNVPYVELTADKQYLVIQISSSYRTAIITRKYITIEESCLHIEGTPEVLTVSDGELTQNASVEDLLSIGTVMDSQKITSGIVTRKIGVYVFDGTEQVSVSGSYNGCIIYTRANHKWNVDNNVIPLCTHFEGLALRALWHRQSWQPPVRHQSGQSRQWIFRG